jgi:hypothetical protein
MNLISRNKSGIFALTFRAGCFTFGKYDRFMENIKTTRGRSCMYA